MYVCNMDDAYRPLGLQTFFTAGSDECSTWIIHKGDKARRPQGVFHKMTVYIFLNLGDKARKQQGVFHTDFEKGFFRAEVIKYNDFACVTLGSESAVRAAGKLATEGKESVVQDGDIMHFLFNVLWVV